MLSDVTPHEAVLEFMQKRGGRVPIFIKSRGHLKIFSRRGVVGTLPSFFSGEGHLCAKWEGVPTFSIHPVSIFFDLFAN
jgi:hypothetical protein